MDKFEMAIFFNPCTGVGSKMTPGVTLKAWHDGEIEVTAMAFHENYSTGGRYLFLLLSRKICGRLKVTPSLYILGHGVIFDPRTFMSHQTMKDCTNYGIHIILAL